MLILCILIVLGGLLAYAPIPTPPKWILAAVLFVAFLLWLLGAFGVIDPGAIIPGRAH